MAGKVIACYSLETWNEMNEYAKESKKLVVTNFFATWSGPCRVILPVFADMAIKFTNVVFLTIDVDDLESVAREFHVKTMPTFVFMKEGEIVDTVVGSKVEKIMETLINHGGIDASA